LAQGKTPTGGTSLLRDNAVIQSQVGVAQSQLAAARVFFLYALEEIWQAARSGTRCGNAAREQQAKRQSHHCRNLASWSSETSLLPARLRSSRVGMQRALDCSHTLKALLSPTCVVAMARDARRGPGQEVVWRTERFGMTSRSLNFAILPRESRDKKTQWDSRHPGGGAVVLSNLASAGSIPMPIFANNKIRRSVNWGWSPSSRVDQPCADIQFIL
jgi:hypothetical protein